MKSRLIALLATVVILLPGSLSAQRLSRSAQPTPEQIVAQMNRERAARGLQPLKLNSTLSLAAVDRVKDMFAKRYFDHVSPDGIDPFTWVTRRGYGYRSIAENLAVGYRSASDVVHGWMTSTGHRENILEKKFEEVGIAIAAGSPDAKANGPLVVAFYGRR